MRTKRQQKKGGWPIQLCTLNVQESEQIFTTARIAGKIPLTSSYDLLLGWFAFTRGNFSRFLIIRSTTSAILFLFTAMSHAHNIYATCSLYTCLRPAINFAYIARVADEWIIDNAERAGYVLCRALVQAVSSSGRGVYHDMNTVFYHCGQCLQRIFPCRSLWSYSFRWYNVFDTHAVLCLVRYSYFMFMHYSGNEIPGSFRKIKSTRHTLYLSRYMSHCVYILVYMSMHIRLMNLL